MYLEVLRTSNNYNSERNRIVPSRNVFLFLGRQFRFYVHRVFSSNTATAVSEYSEVLAGLWFSGISQHILSALTGEEAVPS